MPIIAADLGGTKLSSGLFSGSGDLVNKEKAWLEKRKGDEVGDLVRDVVAKLITTANNKTQKVQAIGISVPGIYHARSGTVWAPNIPGWENYPLQETIQQVAGDIPVVIHSDRACYIVAEVEKGKAKGCSDAVFIAVGTGIGVGIISGGKLLTGAQDIAGAIGWMALERPFQSKYRSCGCFEYSASGDGIARMALEKLKQQQDYSGALNNVASSKLSAHHIFNAFEGNDPVAVDVIRHCIELWGMALANVVSLLNPQKVIFGGGVFGPAVKWLPNIVIEAKQWAQPVSMQHVSVEASSFGTDSGLIGAACLARRSINKNSCDEK